MQLWGFVQDLSQLEGLYGKGWQSFIANSGMISYFGSRDRMTSEYFSALCGETTVWNFSSALSRAFGRSSSSNGITSSSRTTTHTQGNMLYGATHTANIQDRDGAPPTISAACDSFPTLAHLFADGGYAGNKLEIALLNMDGPTIEVVRRCDKAKAFVVIARRWVVERTFAWLGRCRRLAKDWETTISSADAWLLIASIRRQTRHVARARKIR